MNIQNISFLNYHASRSGSIRNRSKNQINRVDLTHSNVSFGASNKQINALLARLEVQKQLSQNPKISARDALGTFRNLGFEAEIDSDDNKIILESYKTPDDIGLINEQELFEHVKQVKGDLVLISHNKNLFPVTKLDNLESIGGNFICEKAAVTSMKSLKSIGGDLSLYGNRNLLSLDSLEEIGGTFWCLDNELVSASNLKTVGQNLFLNNNFGLKNLDSLRTIGGIFYCQSCSIKSLAQLREVGYGIDLSHNQSIVSLPKLKAVKRSFVLSNNQSLTALESLAYVNGSFIFENSALRQVGNLKFVGGDFNCRNSALAILNPDIKIKGRIIQ